VSWVTFETAGGGLLVVQSQHVVAIYDEGGNVKLSTTAGEVHILKDISVRRAASAVAETAVPRPDREDS
jgi:hypothetical protein